MTTTQAIKTLSTQELYALQERYGIFSAMALEMRGIIQWIGVSGDVNDSGYIMVQS